MKKGVSIHIDLQLVAFPQDGVLRSKNGMALLSSALDKGVDVVGGIPHFERTMADGQASVRLLCELAEQRGLMRVPELLDAGIIPSKFNHFF